MVWSFSRLHSYETCPYGFYKRYIEGEPGESNFYAANGKLMHSIFEKILKKEINLQEAVDFYIEEFEYIGEPVKDSIREKCFEDCLNYLCEMDLEWLSEYEVVGIEKEVFFKIGGCNFRAFIDVILKNKNSNEIIIMDHKSSSGNIFKKNGDVLKNMVDQFGAYKHQLYIYAEAYRSFSGSYPEHLWLHHFRDMGKLTKLKFCKDDLNESLNWVKNLIRDIKKDSKFVEKKSYMMCAMLCNFRNNCEYSKED